MSQLKENNMQFIEKITRGLRADTKKSVLAVCLVLLMGILWLKMFTGQTPADASAADNLQLLSEDQADGKNKEYVFVDLPSVAGRNDVLKLNFFASRDGSATSQIGYMPQESQQAVVRRVANLLRLEALGFGKKPEAFINGKLVYQGDVFFIEDGEDKFECKVLEIEENQVTLLFKDSEIKLKMNEKSKNSNL